MCKKLKSSYKKQSKMDVVVVANVSKEAEWNNHAVSQFWLDAVAPLVILLERDEVFQLPVETIQMIQTSILLMGNASFHHSTKRRKALLQHLNPQLKQLWKKVTSRMQPPCCLGRTLEQ